MSSNKPVTTWVPSPIGADTFHSGAVKPVTTWVPSPIGADTFHSG